MSESNYVNCELFLTNRQHARLSVAGRDYSGRIVLGPELDGQLLQAELEPEQYGTLLFQILFSKGEDLLVGYRENLTLARDQGRRLRLRLHVATTAPRELHHLHWELLWDPRQKIALARSQETAFSRYLGLPLQSGKAVVGRPRLLIVNSCPSDLMEYGLPVLNQGAMQQALESSLEPLTELMTWEFLEGPATVERIRDRIISGEFHALHLAAHGLMPLGETAAARLALEADDGRVNFIGEEVFAEIFAGQRDLRLVSLIACHSDAPAGGDPFSGLGPALVERGVPAVVAMRREISLAGATRFTEHFYRNLARSGQVDVAANEARQQMFLGQPDSLEWSTPALYMRLEEGRLWEPSADVEETCGTNRNPTAAVRLESAEDEKEKAEVPVLRTLVLSDLVDRTRWSEELGDRQMAEIMRRSARLARDLLQEHGGREAGRDAGFLMLFERPIHAVRWALAFHHGIVELSQVVEVELAFRIGIHLGEVILIETSSEDVARGAKPLAVEGLARPTAERLMVLARGGQTLLSSAAFDLARRSAVGAVPDEQLHWLAHGEYHLPGSTTPVAIYEVGVEGSAPLVAPDDTREVRRALGDQTILGWRPGIGLEVPQRPHWVLEKKLSEGGFGEVWLARHEKMRQQRVFKFCFEAERLRALQREITLFRLLKEELGDRDDIARILDWNFEEAPYFIESEYAADGDLVEWAEEQGGIASFPMEQRLEIIAQLATALSAAHSVGVLHKDVKPTNVLVARNVEGGLRVRLADFGIGAVTHRELLEASGITVLGLTAKTEDDSSYSGTRLYMAPELLEGKPATLQADIYALGVMMYQVVVGDFSRALAPGWRRDVDDELLCGDVASAVDGSPDRRPGNALRIAKRIRTLESRRRKREVQLREREQARQAQKALARSKKRQKLVAMVMGALVLFGGVMAYQNQRIRNEAERANREAVAAQQISEFLVSLFQISDPTVANGEAVTAREILDRGAEKIERELQGQPEVQARLMHIIGVVYQSLGLYDAALPLLENASATRRQLYGADHAEVVDSLSQLADLLSQRGEYQEAEKLIREAIRLRRKALGNRHVDFAKDLEILAKVLAKTSDFEGAEPFSREALEIRRSMPGEKGPEVANSLSILAEILYAKGDFEAAAKFHRECLELRRRFFGETHMEIASSLNNLGRVLRAKGAYQKAEPFYREAVTMRRRLLGDMHPHIAESLSDLGRLLQAKGDYEGAGKMFREALQMSRRLFDDGHPAVVSNLNMLAHLLRQKGDALGAELLYGQALAMARERLGDEHINVSSSMTGLAIAFQVQGKYVEAERLLRQVLDILRRRLGLEHPWIASTLGHLAVSRQAIGDYSDAERLLNESLEMRRKFLGLEHPHVAMSLNSLANLLRLTGEVEGAEPLFVEAISMRRQLLPGKHPDLAQSLNDFASFQIDRGEFSVAESLAEEALAIFYERLPQNHWRIANAEGLLGASLAGLGRYLEAEALLLSSYDNLSSQPGIASLCAQSLLKHIVALYEAWDVSDKALFYNAMLSENESHGLCL